jgi:hypothetical protein
MFSSGEFIKDCENKLLMINMDLSEKIVQKVFPKAMLVDGIAVAGSSQCASVYKHVLLQLIYNF